MDNIRCWCGTNNLKNFSHDYKKCVECGTLICTHSLDNSFFHVSDDERDYYGRRYWFEHQTDDLDFPDIVERSRKDLSERVIYWLESILKYCLPPAKVLEIGSGHGGFVAMLNQVGFNAAGLELSPWVVKYARDHFQIEMYEGPIEEQSITPSSIDCILLMDVLEHLSNPVATLQTCLKVLKPDGMIFVQTPAYDNVSSYNQLKKLGDPFIDLLIPIEHLYLFNKESVLKLLGRIGVHYATFMQPYFQYDMFFVASRKPISEKSTDEIERILLSTPGGRISLALLDLDTKYRDVVGRLVDSEVDRAARLSDLKHLEDLLKESEMDRASRLETIRTMEVKVEEINKDRTARIKAIDQLEKLLEESEADRAARLISIEKLEKLVRELDTHRNEILDHIQHLELIIKNKQEEFSVLEDKNKMLESQIQALEKELSSNKEWIQIQRRNIHHHIYYNAFYERELSRFPVNFIRRMQNVIFNQYSKLIDRLYSSLKRKKVINLKKVVVDLTPILPGGENGGAKPMTTTLIWQLSRTTAPNIEYVLLTSDDSHEELSWLDSENVQRICVNFRLETPPNSTLDSDAKVQQLNRTISEVEIRKELDNRSVGNHRIPASERIQVKIKAVIHSIGVFLEHTLPRPLYGMIYRFYKHNLKSPKTSKTVSGLEGDLLFCPFTAPLYYEAGIPTVIVVYDLQFKTYPQFFSSEALYNLEHYLERSCKVASRLICISEYTRQSLIDECHLAEDKALTIPISLCNPIKKIPSKLLDRILIKFTLQRKQFLIYPANFWVHKNHEMLITAFNMYLKQNPESPLKLVFTGAPGERMTYLEEAVKKIDLEGRIIFAGFLEVDEYSAIFQASLALIFPSLYEGFGIPLLESMYFGVPVLSSNFTSLTEVGQNAVHYFDPRIPEEIIEAIELIENDNTFRADLIEKGKQRIKDFPNPIRWAENYYEVFKEALVVVQPYWNELTGIYPDHWVGESFEITISDGDHLRFLELNLEVPTWFPSNILRGRAVVNGWGGDTIKAIRGKKNIIRFPVARSGHKIKIKFQQTIQPKELGISEDSRFLSCQMLWCRLLTPESVESIYEAGIA